MIERLQQACSRVLAKGYRVQAGEYGVAFNHKANRWAPLRWAHKCMCPLGALVVVERPKPGKYGTVPEAVAGLLGVEVSWVLDFQMTFDGLAPWLEGDAADAARAVLTWLADQSPEALPAPPVSPSA